MSHRGSAARGIERAKPPRAVAAETREVAIDAVRVRRRAEAWAEERHASEPRLDSARRLVGSAGRFCINASCLIAGDQSFALNPIKALGSTLHTGRRTVPRGAATKADETVHGDACHADVRESCSSDPNTASVSGLTILALLSSPSHWPTARSKPGDEAHGSHQLHHAEPVPAGRGVHRRAQPRVARFRMVQKVDRR
jgi:hypothetical protein